MRPMVSNLQSFHDSLKYNKAKIEHKATAYYRDFVRAMLRDLAANTPQWSGNLAASWQVVVGKGAQPVTPLANEIDSRHWSEVDPTRWMGHRDAVRAALEFNEFAIQSIRWNSHVAIVNTYPALVDGEIKEENLREGNYIDGDFMAVAYVAQKYSHKNGRGVQITPTLL